MGRRSKDRRVRGSNTRASERLRLGVPSSVKWGDKQLTGVIELVNLGGMYVATARSPEIGDYVDFLFSIPGYKSNFRVRGSVVFLDPEPDAAADHPPGFGARFERPPVALLEAIKAIDKKEH